MCRRVLCLAVGIVCVLAIFLGASGYVFAVDTAKAKKTGDQKTSKSASEKAIPTANVQSDRDKVWNSPEMLWARAWMEEYFRVSKKYTPEQKKEYRKHLASMTAPQMELWLMQFEEERQVAAKKNEAEKQNRAVRTTRGLAEIRNQQNILKNIEKDEHKQAAQQEKTINQDRQFARSMYKQQQREAAQATMEYSSGGFGWGGFGGGFSDERLKRDLKFVGTSPSGIKIYRFRYRGDSRWYEGVLAQELLLTHPEAVVFASSGYMMVHYGLIDVPFRELSECDGVPGP